MLLLLCVFLQTFEEEEHEGDIDDDDDDKDDAEDIEAKGLTSTSFCLASVVTDLDCTLHALHTMLHVYQLLYYITSIKVLLPSWGSFGNNNLLIGIIIRPKS